MKTPPFLLGAALLLWGWRTEVLWLALALAIVVESIRHAKVRFEFAQQDLDRFWNLCVVLFVASGVFLFALSDGFENLTAFVTRQNPSERLQAFNQGAVTAVRFLQYTPVTVLPILLAQAVSRRDRIPWSTFSYLLRKRRAATATGGHTSAPEPGVNVSYPYLAVVLFSATLSAGSDPWFVAAFAGVVGWTLHADRPRTYRWQTWAGTLAAAIALGLVAMAGLLQLQQLARGLDSALMARLGAGRDYDPKGTWTRLGSVGSLKQSSSIVFRLETRADPPALLREASYDQFKAPVWGSSKRHFERTLPDAIDTSWPLVPKARAASTVTISTYLPGGNGLLALPAGSVRLTDLPVFLLQTNAHGAVQVAEGPGFVEFQARYRDGPSFDSGPGADDLRLPPSEETTIRRVAARWGLPGTNAGAALHALQRHFAAEFAYTSWLTDHHAARSNQTALAIFLEETHSGHCEYFATATTLLLRAAGIPARYAVGYAVQEKRGRQYVVRGRDAHAWTLAWLDGRWQDIDTTPATWIGAESHHASFWQPVHDFLSDAWFQFSKWRWGRSDWKQHLVWVVIPLVGLGVFHVLRQKQWRRIRPTAGSLAPARAWPGLDSELYQIERRLRDAGLDRRPGETMDAWLARAELHLAAPIPRAVGRQLLELHYRLRFDPAGLPPAERGRLRALAEPHYVAGTKR